jgi:hypothetical protein
MFARSNMNFFIAHFYKVFYTFDTGFVLVNILNNHKLN